MYKNQLNCNDFENNDYFTIEFKPIGQVYMLFLYRLLVDARWWQNVVWPTSISISIYC